MGVGDLGTAQPTARFLLLSEYWRLVLEICHLTEEMRPQWTTPWLRERLIDLSRPVLAESEACGSDGQRFELLTTYFFAQCGFRAWTLPPRHLHDYLLPQVLVSKRGPAPLLMLLLGTLLEESGIRIQVLSCRERHLLRVHLGGSPMILDFDQQCLPLKADDILELINQGFDFSQGPLSPAQMVIDYLEQVKAVAEQDKNWSALTISHSHLMRYQPFNLKHLRDRALLAYETGDYLSAIEDIRSYFLYKQPGLAPDPLKKIYKLALRKLQQVEK